MKLFHFFAGTAPADQEGATAQDARYLIEDYRNVTIPGLERELAEVEVRLARPGRYAMGDEHERDAYRRDELLREIAAFKDRIPDLEAEAAGQEAREKSAALDVRAAAYPGLQRRGRAQNAKVIKARDAYVAELAAMKEVEDEAAQYRAAMIEAGRDDPAPLLGWAKPPVIEPAHEEQIMEFSYETVEPYDFNSPYMPRPHDERKRITAWRELDEGQKPPPGRNVRKSGRTRFVDERIISHGAMNPSALHGVQIEGHWPPRG